MVAYLPTPGVQKPGDNPKNLADLCFFGFHFFQCNNCTLPTKLCISQIEASISPPPPGHTLGIWRLFLPGGREFD